MKKLLLLVLVFTSLACSEDEDPELRSFFVEASIQHEGIDYPIDQEFTVYYFEGINVTEGYTPQPNGILIHDETGNSINYTREFIVNNENGKVVFNDLPRDIHSFIVDLSETLRQDIEIETIVAQAFNVGTEDYSGSGIELHFHISPYTPTTVYQ